MVDTDMVFAADALDRLLEVADSDVQPVVGGLCFAAADKPVMFRLGEDGAPARVTEWPEGALVPVDATGAACLLMHRSVLVEMGERNQGAAYPWFVEGAATSRGALLGEDTAFCLRARGMGVPIVVDTSVRVGHVKTSVIGEVA